MQWPHSEEEGMIRACGPHPFGTAAAARRRSVPTLRVGLSDRGSEPNPSHPLVGLILMPVYNPATNLQKYPELIAQTACLTGLTLYIP